MNSKPSNPNAGESDKKLQAILQPTYQHPVHELLDSEQLETLHQTSLEILAEVGMDFYSENARNLLAEAGMRVTGETVYFDPTLVEKYVAEAPGSFQQLARNPARNVIVGDGRLCMAPVYGPPFVRDLAGGRRSATIKDFENFVKLAYASQYINHSGGTVVEPNDLPQETRHLDMLKSHIRFSDKPFMGSVTSGQNAADSLEIARILFGPDQIKQNPALMSLININSPRQFDEGMLAALTTYAQANQATVITPFILSGAMAPISIAGTVVQQNAEVLAGITYAQIVNPGAPVVYGSFMTNIDLKSGAPVFGSAESQLGLYASAQLSRRYGLPFRSGGMFTSAKLTDPQSAYESMMTMLPAINAHTNLILHAAGWLENGLTAGYEKFMLDDEILGMIHRFLAGYESFDSEGLALDSIRQVEPGGHHLGTEHTMRHFREAFHRPDIFDYQDLDSWQQAGAVGLEQRAAQRVEAVLADFQPPHLDEAVEKALEEFFASRKQELLAG